jgi:Na+-transporting methylmalonyl-CoA/oxaloacetate decarboxylase gamma subunit
VETETLIQGAQIFAIGFGGVFLALSLVWIAIVLLGRILTGLEKKKQPEP